MHISPILHMQASLIVLLTTLMVEVNEWIAGALESIYTRCEPSWPMKDYIPIYFRQLLTTNLLQGKCKKSSSL